MQADHKEFRKGRKTKKTKLPTCMFSSLSRVPNESSPWNGTSATRARNLGPPVLQEPILLLPESKKVYVHTTAQRRPAPESRNASALASIPT